MKNRRATGTTTATATTPRSGVSVRSRLDLSSALQRAHRPTARSARESAEGVGTGRGLCRLPPVRARARRAEARGARASLALAANTAGPSCYTAPGRLDEHHHPSSSSSLTRRLARTLSRSRGDAAKSGARCGRRGAGSRRAPERRRSIRLSFFLSLVRERVPSIPLYTIVSVRVSFAVAVAAARVRATGRAGPPRNVNDPSAGSPTETLLRLLLPLNDQVWSSSRQHRQCRRIAAHQSEDLTKSFNR